MFEPGAIASHLSFRDKVFSLDIILIVSILLLGIISCFAMYSTDGGEFAYHTKSHIVRFFIFFSFIFCGFLFFIKFLVQFKHHLIYNSSCSVNFSKVFWSNLFRIAKMVESLFS